MQIPESDVKACAKCHQPVVSALTNRMSQGQPVSVLVEPEEDVEQHGSVSETWMLTKTAGDTYYAGQVTNRNQRAAMLNKGVRFHVEHKKTCGTPQPTTRRRYK